MSTLLGSSAAIAQPSDEVVAARLKNAGAIEVKFTSAHGTVHTLPNEKYYERTTESKWKTDIPTVFRWERVDNRYDYHSGSWVFNRSYFGGAWYDGIPNPSEEEIVRVLEESHAGYQGSVMVKPTFKLAENPKWNWHTFNSVEFNVEVTYFKKISYSEVAKIHTIIPVRLYKDCGGGVYNPSAKEIFKNAPWLKVNMAFFPSTNDDKQLEVRTLSESEQNSVMTVEELSEAIENENKKKLWSDFHVPAFQSDQEAIQFIHKVMWDGDLNQIEWMAYTLFDRYYFADDQRTLMNEAGKELLAKMMQLAPNYMYLYCEFPEVKHQQANMLQYYDREGESFGRIAVVPTTDNSYRLNQLDCLFNPSQDKLERCKKSGLNHCGTQAAVRETVKTEQFAANDLVTVNWNGQGKDFYKGKIQKVDPYDANRYFVEFETIQSAWIDAKFITKRTDAGTAESARFEVGQRIQGNWKGQGKWYSGKIAECDSKTGKYLIRYDDGDQEWTTPEYIK